MDKRINKVKYNAKTGEVLIEYEIISADDVKVTLKSEDKPLPEFIEQFENLYHTWNKFASFNLISATNQKYLAFRFHGVTK